MLGQAEMEELIMMILGLNKNIWVNCIVNWILHRHPIEKKEKPYHKTTMQAVPMTRSRQVRRNMPSDQETHDKDLIDSSDDPVKTGVPEHI